MPRWDTWELITEYGFARPSDLSTKRNLGLMLSHLLGWNRILFLDDDLTGLEPERHLGCERAAEQQQRGRPASRRLPLTTPSSVTPTGRPAAGSDPSSAAAHSPSRWIGCNSFFPDIYNDDWFFLLDGDKRLQPTAVTGRVYQYPYDPFRNPNRARDEEFGDVLAEGVFWLLDQDLSLTDADRGHWERFLVTRREFIDDVVAHGAGRSACRRMSSAAGSQPSTGHWTASARITPDLCARYLDAWRNDLRRWARLRNSQPTGIPRSAIDDGPGAGRVSRLGLARPDRRRCSPPSNGRQLRRYCDPPAHSNSRMRGSVQSGVIVRPPMT